MKKICCIVLAVLIIMGCLGCSNKDVDYKVNGSSAQSTVDSKTGNTDADDSESNNIEWTEIKVNTLREADNFFHLNGFPEVMLKINEEYLDSDFLIASKDDVLKIDLTYMGAAWTMYAAKVDDVTGKINLGVDNLPKFKLTHDATAHMSFTGGVVVYDNNNVYVCRCNSPAPTGETTALKVVYFDERAFGQDGRDCNTKDREHLEFLIRKEMLNGEEITMTFRCGTTWEQWANSELNTDGWFIPELHPSYVLNADKTAFLVAYDIAGWTSPVSLLEPGKHPWYTQVLDEVQNSILFDGERMIEDAPTGFRNGFVYCRNSFSPLCVEGFKISVMESESDYRWKALFNSFTHGDHVLINVKGVFPENMEHVKVFVTPHESDDFGAIPETCTEVQMTLDRDIMSGVYDSAIDSFNKTGDVDILFTYDGEIVYHVTLNKFA